MSGYEGKVTNAGAQEIKAPHPQNHSPKGGVIKTGNDLRQKGGRK